MATITHTFEKTTTPVFRVEVTGDCTTLAEPTFQILEQPPQFSYCHVHFKRYTAKCSGDDKEWCTKEVWRVLLDYEFKSDASPDKFHQTDLLLGELECDCDCVKISSRLCIDGKSVASSGLQKDGENYHTDYTVEFTATLDGAFAKKWTQGIRVEGGRSWYGYYYSKCFDLNPPDKRTLASTLSGEGLSAPGFEPEPNV